jgi:hypothetical protein
LTNLPVLLKFFDNKTLATLRGDDFFPLEPNITLPDFKYFSHKITDTFATQNKMSHDLARTAEAVMNNRYIVDSLGQSLILGDVELDKDLFWFSAKGVTMEITVVITVCLVFASIHFYFRLRKLTIALLLLQAKGLPHTEARPEEGLRLNYFDAVTSMSDPQSRYPYWQMIFRSPDNNWIYLYVGVVTTILVVIIGRKVYRRARKYCPENSHCYFALEFIQGGHVLTVPLIKVSGTPVQYTVSATDFIEEVHVVGVWKTSLVIDWTSLQILNKLTSTMIPLKNEVSISPITAYHLKRMLSTAFECYPFWMTGKERLRIDLTQPQNDTHLDTPRRTAQAP